MKKLKLHYALFALILTLASLPAPIPVKAQRPRLQTPICALSAGQLACYSAEGTQRAITTADQTGLDFDVSPDGEWIVYRAITGDQIVLRMASVFGGGAPIEIDAQAAPPPIMPADARTLAWSPDGIIIGYVTTSGLRIAFPDQAGAPQYAEVTDRRYVDLRFSPSGSRLAARSEDGSWTIFQVQDRYTANARLALIRTLTLSAELGWLDETRVLIAPTSGGLYALDTSDPNAQFSASSSPGLYQQLVHLPDGTVRALNVEIGQGFATPVQIDASLTVTPLGEFKLDTRLQWARQGRGMIYLTSGTVLTVDPITSEENTLPLRNIDQVVWSPPAYEQTDRLALDADLYYLAPDQGGIPQLFRLLRNGQEPVQQLTQSTVGIRSFSVSPDKRLICVQDGQILRVLPLTVESLVTPTPNAFSVAQPTSPATLIVNLRRSDSAAPSWSFDSTQIAYADEDGIYVAPADGSGTARRVTANEGGRRFDVPLFSPDNRALLVEDRSAASGTRTLTVIALTGAGITDIAPLARNGIDTAFWSAPNDNRVAVVILRFDGTTTKVSLFSEGQEQTVAEIAAPVLTAAFARNVTTPPLLILTRLGWTRGPQVLQYEKLALSSNSAVQILSDPAVLAGSLQLSPTGRFAFALQRVDSTSTSNQLVILDLQNQRKILIENAVNINDLRWIF